MEMQPPAFSEGETLIHEIKTSPRTVAYYSVMAAPLIGVWFIGLLAFLLWSYRAQSGDWKMFLIQALAISGLAYLVGAIMRWLWRVDVLQRDAWLTNKGIWVHISQTTQFIPFLAMTKVSAREDWASKRMGIGKIEITYRAGEKYSKIVLVGIENDQAIANELMERVQNDSTSLQN